MQLAKNRPALNWHFACFTFVCGLCVTSGALAQQYQGSQAQYQQQYRTQQGNAQQQNAMQQGNRQVTASQVGYQRPAQGAQTQPANAANQNGARQGYPGASVQPQGQQIPIVKPGQAVEQGSAQVAALILCNALSLLFSAANEVRKRRARRRRRWRRRINDFDGLH